MKQNEDFFRYFCLLILSAWLLRPLSLVIILLLWEANKIDLRRQLRRKVEQLPPPKITTIDLKMWSDPGWDRIRVFCEAERQGKVEQK